MKLVIMRTQAGTFMGNVDFKFPPSKLSDELDLLTLHDPAMVDFLTMPGALKFGQQTIVTLHHIVAWPERTLTFYSPPIMYSVLSNELSSDGKFIKLYEQCIDEKWRTGNIKIN